MICGQFTSCVKTLKQEVVIPKKPKEKQKRNKTNRQPKREVTYSSFPCDDKNRMNKCICFCDSRSKASCTENGKTYTLDHSKIDVEVLCMHLDGGVIANSDSKKCDYALFVRDNVDNGYGRAVFVELKGGGTETALKQLLSTLTMPEVIELRRDYKRVYGRIVNTSSAPRIQNTSDYMELKELLLQFGGNLKTEEWDFCELYPDLDK